MKVEMVKHLGGLRPVDDAGQQLLSSLKHGQSVMVEVKRPRNVLHHRKLFALLNLVQQNQTHYPNVYALLKALQVYCGYCDTLPTKSGKMATVPKSIAFENMDQAEFGQLYDAFIDAVVTHVIPGLAESDLRREVESICGIGEAA